MDDITSYEQCEVGKTVQGFVATIRNNGLLVVFFNNVKVILNFITGRNDDTGVMHGFPFTG